MDYLDRDAHLVARASERERQGAGCDGLIDTIDMIPSALYRNQGAYLVGRIRAATASYP